MQPFGGPAPQAQPTQQPAGAPAPASAMDADVYLTQANQRYDSLRSAISNITTAAAEQARDLSPQETEAINGLNAQAVALRGQIDILTDAAHRDAQVNMRRAQLDMAVFEAQRLAGQAPGNDPAQLRGMTNGRPQGGATAQDRDPGLYLRHGQHSFIGDQWQMARGSREAQDRLFRHSNALRDDTHLRDVLGAGATTFGAGLVPPVWLAELFAPILHRRLRVASQVRQVPWPGSPFAWSIPVAGTAITGTQVAEGINPSVSDPSYTVLTVTPKALAGEAKVSRQMLDASNPAVDAVIYQDLIGNFFDNAETDFITALVAQAGVNTVTVSAGVASTTDLFNQRQGLLNGIAAISDNSAGDPTIFAGRTSRWTTYLLLQDANGRPLVTAEQYPTQLGPIGRGDLGQAFASPVQGRLESLSVVTSPTIAASTGFIINGDELLFSYSPPLQFAFEQPSGPAEVVIGVWGYEAIVTGRRPKAITKITYSGS